jgi:hypothetical protein
MADFARVTIIPTPDTHPGHEQPFLTWVNLALVYQLQPATDADHPGARTPDRRAWAQPLCAGNRRRDPPEA